MEKWSDAVARDIFVRYHSDIASHADAAGLLGCAAGTPQQCIGWVGRVFSLLLSILV
jgi:hypothetical protein